MEKRKGRNGKVALWLAVLLCGIVAVVGLSSVVRRSENQITITPEVLYGDPAIVEGMDVQVRTQISGVARWTTDFTIGEEAQAQTAVDHLSHQDPEDMAYLQRQLLSIGFGVRPMVNGISVDMNENTLLSGGKEIRMEWLQNQFGQVLDQVSAQCEPGESTVQTVWLKDCFKNYPISVGVSTSYTWSNMGIIQDGVSYLTEDGAQWADRLSAKLQKYFPIPVVEDDRVTVLMEKGQDGEVTSVSFNAWSGGTANSFDAITESGIYFVLGMSPERYDYSQVPGGYGLYYLPTMEKDGILWVLADELTTVMPLDVDQEIKYLWSDENGETVVLQRKEKDGRLVLDIMDVATGHVVQTIGRGVTPEWDDYDEYSGWIKKLLIRDDFMVMELRDATFLLYEKQMDGSYQFRFAGDPDQYTEKLYQWTHEFDVMPSDHVGIDYDGKYLAVSWFAPYDSQELAISSNQSCDIYVAVYGEEGLVYYGVYHNSLSTGGTGSVKYDSVYPTMVDPVTLSWPETR